MDNIKNNYLVSVIIPTIRGGGNKINLYYY